MQTIKTKVVLHSPHVTMERNGDCIDLNFCGLDKFFKLGETGFNHFKKETDTLHYSKGSIFRVKLGFSMEIPEGKRANVYQRSGTRKNFGVLLTNHVGIIDNSYKGTDDQWMAEFYAIEDGEMKLGDRILQFEIVDVMPKVEFDVVESFDNENRGGFSSTGIR